MKSFQRVAVVFLCGILFSLEALAQTSAPSKDSDSGGASGLAFGGPSVHFSLGVKTKKAPLLDEYYSVYGGVKASLMSVGFGDQVYVSILALGLHLQKDALFTPSLSPVIINHKFGVGLSVDFFPVSDRDDRPGGPFGIALNVDLIRIAQILRP